MWNENSPLELLKEMNSDLTNENLVVIQQAIDVDKYENSQLLCKDLCGEYAPFCVGCDKSKAYPCAVSYIHMKQAQGMQITISDNLTEREVEQEIVLEKNPKRIRIAVAKRKRT